MTPANASAPGATDCREPVELYAYVRCPYGLAHHTGTVACLRFRERIVAMGFRAPRHGWACPDPDQHGGGRG